MLELNKIYLGDCLEIMKQIDNQSIDMILCDPPYGITACKWDSIISLESMWGHLKRIIKPNGVIVMTASQPFTTILISSNIDMFKYCWVWVKNSTSGFALAKKQPMRNHEDILVFYKKQPTYNPIKEKRDLNEKSKQRMNYEFSSEKGQNQIQNGIKKVKFIPEDKELSYPKTVQKINNIANNDPERSHPTQKPVALGQYLIKTYTNENDIILDFATGVGSFCVAAKIENRNFIGIEKEEKYVEIAKKRIEDKIKEKASLLF